MMRKLALLIALAVPFAAAQEERATQRQRNEPRRVPQAAAAQEQNAGQQQKQPPRAARVFAITNGDPDGIAMALRTAGANTTIERRLKMIVVSAEPSLMSDLSGIVQKLDVPAPAPKSIEITAYLIQASLQAADSGPMPAELEPVLKQARSMFNYQGFKLLDSPILRSRESQTARVSGTLLVPGTQPGQNRYELYYRPSVVGDRIIRLDEFGLGGLPVSVRTDVEFVEGQKVVVGKSGLDGGDRALMIVVTGKIVQ